MESAKERNRGSDDIANRICLDDEGRLLMDGVPMLMVTRGFAALLQQTAEEFIGVNGAALILYHAGFKGGYNLAKSFKPYGMKGPAILEACLHLASLRGWGIFGLVELDMRKMRADVIIRASPAEEMKSLGRPVCHLMRGIIAGILQYIAETAKRRVKIRGIEVKCIAKGDPYCEIVAEPYAGPGEEG